MEKTLVEIGQEVEGKVKNAVAEMSGIVVKSDEDMNRAATVLTNVKKLAKFLKQEKDKILNPLKEATNVTKALFAPMEDKLNDAESKLRQAMGDYQTKKVAAQEKKIDSIAKRVETGQLKEETGIRKLEELGEVEKAVHTGEGTVSFRKVKKVRMHPLKEMLLGVADYRFLASEGYIVWDEVQVRKRALAQFVIPGVEVYEETSVATTV